MDNTEQVALLERECEELRDKVAELEALVGTVRAIAGCRTRNVRDIGYEQHSREIGARFAELKKQVFRMQDEAIFAYGQIYGLINEGEYDKAQDFCRSAGEWWTQEIAELDDDMREGK